jgi:flagellar basal-body rod protein FlgB
MTAPVRVFPHPPGGTTRNALVLATGEDFAEYSDCSGALLSADADDMQSLNPQFDLLGRLINATEVRHRVISNNIANVNTPNYQRMDIEFEQQLAKEMSKPADSGGNSSIHARPEMILTPGLKARADGNNVDIDREIGQLNKNAMMQQTYVQLLSTYLEQMKLAIQG